MCSDLPQVQDIHVDLADVTQDLQDNKAAFGIGRWRPNTTYKLALDTQLFKGFHRITQNHRIS